LLGMLGDGLAELVRLGIGNAGHLCDHVVYLLLEDDAAIGLAKRLGQARMQKVGPHPAVAARDEALDHMPLDWPRTDERHGRYQVLEMLRIERDGQGHLGRTLEL